MSLQLKRPSDQFPPGGFGFKDARTGMMFNGYEGTPAMTAVKVIAHREANPSLYPRSEGHWFSVDGIVQEIFEQKYATMPWLFIGGPDDPGLPTPQPRSLTAKGVCVCGATETEPVYCKTCGGQKVVNYKCKACGQERP